MSKIKQGDAYYIPITITKDGNSLAIEDVEDIEFVIGNLVKHYPTEVVFDSETNDFLFPITQEESFLFNRLTVGFDVRVKWTSGVVLGLIPTQKIDIAKALSREVL